MYDNFIYISFILLNTKKIKNSRDENSCVCTLGQINENVGRTCYVNWVSRDEDLPYDFVQLIKKYLYSEV